MEPWYLTTTSWWNDNFKIFCNIRTASGGAIGPSAVLPKVRWRSPMLAQLRILRMTDTCMIVYFVFTFYLQVC